VRVATITATLLETLRTDVLYPSLSDMIQHHRTAEELVGCPAL
jgi:hypothetical protein